MKRFLIKFGITLLAFLGSMAFVFAFIYPIFELLFVTEWIGYWERILGTVSISVVTSLICLISVYRAKKNDEYCR